MCIKDPFNLIMNVIILIITGCIMTYNFFHPLTCVSFKRVEKIQSVSGREATVMYNDGSKAVLDQPFINEGLEQCVKYERK